MICNSILALTGIASFGIGDATIKYVAQYVARNDKSRLLRIIQSSFFLYIVLGILTAATCWILAPILVDILFKIDSQFRSVSIAAIQITALGIIIRFFNSVQSAIIRGYQRYDIETRNIIIWTSGTTILACFLVFLGFSLIVILMGSIVMICISSLLYSLSITHLLHTWSWLYPRFNKASIQEIFSFGMYSWLGSIARTATSQIDRFLIIGTLGTQALAYYTVCLQLTQFGLSTISRITAFFFPWSAEMLEKNNLEGLQKVFVYGTSFATGIGCALTLPLALFSHSILTLWVGQDIANNASTTLTILAIFYGFRSIFAIPVSFLYGTGFVRISTILSIFSAAGVLYIMWILIPIFGLNGAAIASFANIPGWIIMNYILHRNTLKDVSSTSGIKIVMPVAVIFTVGLIFKFAFNEYFVKPHLLPTLLILCTITAGIAVLFGACLSYLSLRYLLMTRDI